MAQEMEKLGGTSEDEEEEEMELGIKEEEGDEGDEVMGDDIHSRAIVIGGPGSEADTSAYFVQPAQQTMDIEVQQGSGAASRRCRPKEEKERTKLRERHRRAITARILAGLRRHGNYNLRVRADINEVIAALAREAGWTVLPDGTTFPSRSASPQVAPPTL